MKFDSKYQKQVELLLKVMPSVDKESCFALKGGTAINLFYQDVPRLSVDLDLVYTQKLIRQEAYVKINEALDRISSDLRRLGYMSFVSGTNERKIICTEFNTTIKIEPNYTFRGTVLQPERKSVSTKVQDLFGFAQMQVLARDELYAGKFCAALDRQHPRDLFDVKQMYSSASGLTEKMVQSFVVYLLGHNRPIHELLDCEIQNRKDIFEKEFMGMTDVPVSYQELQEALQRLKRELKEKLQPYKEFMLKFVSLEVDFAETVTPEVLSFPAIQWKRRNLEQLKKADEKKFRVQRDKLESYFS